LSARSRGPAPGIGALLRAARERKRLSQLDLASAAEVSSRHLSYVETGRAQPSRAMVLRLAERLDVPLRERNAWLAAAGYAPLYRERDFADPAFATARRAVETVLAAHEPFPALAIDRHWRMLAHNRAVPPLLAGVDPRLLAPPVNVIRLCVDPRGLAPRIANLATWRHHLTMRLAHQVRLTGDATLQTLLHEVVASGPPSADAPAELYEADALAIPLKLVTPDGTLSFISTTTVFGTPLDVTLAEIALETFFPADDATARALGVTRGTA
jgi:transcriptional regulator with XRE-family HTH domain